MVQQTFMDRLRERWRAGHFVCVGLDSDILRLPERSPDDSTKAAIQRFNEAIIDATSDLVAVYKPNIAFYENCGAAGLEALAATIRYIHDTAPGAVSYTHLTLPTIYSV